jgi:glycosyl-4,4'-diaponeurosporenoate acyltransferase
MKSYYEPKKFEFYGNHTIYDYVGIRWYKKYLPFTGDLARKWRNLIQINLNKSQRINELYRYEKKTRNYEIRHIIGIIIFLVLVFLSNKKLTLFDIVFLTFLNLSVNIYPILLQRYNRIRIIKLLKNLGEKSPYDK